VLITETTPMTYWLDFSCPVSDFSDVTLLFKDAFYCLTVFMKLRLGSSGMRVNQENSLCKPMVHNYMKPEKMTSYCGAC